MKALEKLARDLRGKYRTYWPEGEDRKYNEPIACSWDVVAVYVQQLQREAWIAGRDAAAALEREIYFRLIGFEAVPCPCGNGRIPTGTYDTATKRFAEAICALEPPAQETDR